MSVEKKYLGDNGIMYDRKTISSPVDLYENCEVTRVRREYITHAEGARARVLLYLYTVLA